MLTHFIGPCHVLGGNPTTASGMVYLGDTRGRIAINPRVEVATGRLDRFGRAPIADGIFVTGAAPLVTVPFVDEAKAKMVKHILGTTLATVSGKNALLFPSRPKQIAVADIMTLCLLPIRPAVTDYPANVADDEEAWWLPAAIPTGDPEFGFELPEGDDVYAGQAHTVQFMGAVRLKDHNNVAIPQDAQVIFRGSATGAGVPGWLTGMPARADLAALLEA
jgi:hypothetical protein